jgi:predicted DNA-binding antitoxin AbrB/MazE fold protein
MHQSGFHSSWLLHRSTHQQSMNRTGVAASLLPAFFQPVAQMRPWRAPTFGSDAIQFTRLDFPSLAARLIGMTSQFDAIYDSGVFKPLTPLSLPDKARVRLTIDEQQVVVEQHQPLPMVEARDEWERQLLSAAKNCGVSLPDSAFISDALYE